MYSKKIAFSLFTVPALVLSHQGYEFQTRRKEDKEIEATRRTTLMSQSPLDITPLNRGGFPWSKPGTNIDNFESDFSFKKVKVSGFFDHNNEIQVERIKGNEKGVDIVTPFFTHLNEKGEPCGILVNRGWVPVDLKDLKMHYTSGATGEIQGLLYRGDAQTKYSLANEPTIMRFTNVNPSDIALIDQMKNLDEASQFMLLQIDPNTETRQILPTAPTADELAKWQVSPERHQAYADLWKYLTFTGIFANTALWLCF